MYTSVSDMKCTMLFGGKGIENKIEVLLIETIFGEVLFSYFGLLYVTVHFVQFHV